jgi:hypothetical protein
MVDRRLAAAAAGAILTTLGYVGAQQPSPPELGAGPEMFDWGAGWLAAILRFLSSTLILAVAIGLVICVVRWIGGSWTRPSQQPPGGERPAVDR